MWTIKNAARLAGIGANDARNTVRQFFPKRFQPEGVIANDALLSYDAVYLLIMLVELRPWLLPEARHKVAAQIAEDPTCTEIRLGDNGWVSIDATAVRQKLYKALGIR